MTLHEAIVVLMLFLAGFALWRHFEISQRAYQAAKAYTQRNDVLLLDETIVLSRLRLRFSKRLFFYIERHYDFEFATLGDVRYRGFVTLHGPHVGHIFLQPFKAETAPP